MECGPRFFVAFPMAFDSDCRRIEFRSLRCGMSVEIQTDGGIGSPTIASLDELAATEDFVAAS